MRNSSLTAIQQSIMNFGILMVQGLVNSFGFEASAAFAAVVYYLRRRKVLLGKKQKRN